jgi:N,N'-diacetyllegionaminate synthase
MRAIDIAGREVGPGHRAFVIAEVGQNHDGSLGTAHAYIDAVAETGCDAIKFQTHIAAEESTLDEPFRVKFSRQDATRYDYWKRMEFTPEQWAGLADHARDKSLVFLSSPFSEAAIEMLGRIGMPAWKVGSGEVFNANMLSAMVVFGVPVLLSSGMSSYDEIALAVDSLRRCQASFAVFQCTSAYPVPPERVGLNVLEELRRRFDCPVGLSDHSGTVFPALAAMARGASLVEVHITLSRQAFGPDVPASVDIEGLRLICAARDAFQRMDSHPVDKDAVAREMRPMRAMFGKSLAPRRALPRGTVLESGMLTLKKPGTGIPAEEMNTILGKELVKDVVSERLLRREDVGE